MAHLTDIVEGWTSRLSFQLLEDGAAMDGMGITVSALDIVAADGTVVTTTSDFGWLTQASGTVYYDPDAADFTAAGSPYSVRFQLTDGTGKVAWHPNGKPDQIRVFPRGVSS